MAKFDTFFRYVEPTPEVERMTNNQDMTGSYGFGNYSWYHTLVQGSSQRLTKYKEYDLMDDDVEVARALDTIAEEMTGNNPKTDMPLEIDMETSEEELDDKTVLTIKAALRHWCRLHDWENRLFKIARNTIKYGDMFFTRASTRGKRWTYVHPRSVIAALVDKDDAANVLGWQIKNKTKEAQPHTVGLGTNNDDATYMVSADDIVRFTTNDDMSDLAPFGESILSSVYKAHKQKELLEDAIIIYRISRAPERRVFHIDVGTMPPARRKKYLDGIKNEIRQKKIPTGIDGKSSIESTYNPQSMSEDYFFATGADGRGSRVETLPGGAGLGELADLEYFQKKTWRGLRIPDSYMQQGAEGAIFNDGKVGVAYIQEMRFALYVMRLQGCIERVMDHEFKTYLRDSGIHIDDTTYRLRLPEPSNFGTYRQMEMDAQLLNAFAQADAIPYASKRFIAKRYLLWTDEEIVTNEAMLREEKGIVSGEEDELRRMYDQEGMAADMEASGMGDEGGTELGDDTEITT